MFSRYQPAETKPNKANKKEEEMITPEGDYLSNLQAPDLRQYFRHLHWRVMPHSMGHLVASDWADKGDDDPVFGLYKNCGLWTRDEVAILCECVQRTGMQSAWIDIGSHTGWTSKHINWMSNGVVYCVDPILRERDFAVRFYENCGLPWRCPVTSNEYFEVPRDCVNGIVIDGDHEPGKPLEDAQNAAKHLADTGVILFHDFLGAPVREAVTWLMDQGFKARVYWTPHIVACCWRGDFTPPDHESDKRIDWRPHVEEMKLDFDFGRLS